MYHSCPVQAERVKLQEQKVEMLEHVVRLQHQLEHQEKQLRQVDDLLSNSARSWWGGRQLPAQDLLGVLLNEKSG